MQVHSGIYRIALWCLKKKKGKPGNMQKRFVSIWFRHLITDWFAIRNPEVRNAPFVLSSPLRGRMIVVAANAIAQSKGIHSGMVLADARAEVSLLKVLDDRPGLAEKLLKRLAEHCIRFTPYVSVDLPDGLILDVTGCSHLWGGDEQYLTEIVNRLTARGYVVRVAMGDTTGAAWAIARYGSEPFVVKKGNHV